MVCYPVEETAERHERIVASASRLFRERGFDGVSVAEVMKDAGLTHGGFYAHFASKEDLAAAGLERALSGMLDLAGRSAAAADGRGAFVRRYASRQHRDQPGLGCAMVALAPEVARRAGAVRRTFTDKLAELIGRMAGSRQKSARAGAIVMTAALVGAVLLARAVDEPALSDEILAAVRASFGVEAEG